MAEPPFDGAVLLRGDGLSSGVVGGKGASLDRLIALGVAVPTTGGVTTAAYRRFVDQGGLADLVHELVTAPLPAAPDHPAAAERVDSAFAEAPMSTELAEQIVDLASAVSLAADRRLVAVRSSAVAEDLAAASFAGQYRSFLDIDPSGPALLEAVRLTWASLWHPAPRTYRRFRRVPETDLTMAVIVMAMLSPTEAGVIFTVDPAGDPRHLRIEAIEGLADELVAGTRTPRVRLIERDPAQMAPETPPLMRRLTRLALDIESSLGAPQDLEWAAESDRLWIVQARPITTTATRGGTNDGFDSTPRADATYTVAGVGEMLPGLLPPLTWSDAARPVENGFLRLFDQLGGDVADVAERPLLVRLRARAALDLEHLEAVVAGVPGGSAAEVRSQYLGTASASGGASDQRRRVGAIMATRTIRARWAAALEGEVLVRAVEILLDTEPDSRTLAEIPASELAARRRRLLDLVDRGVAAEMAVAAMATAAYRNVERSLTKALPADATAMTQRLTSPRRAHDRSGSLLDPDRLDVPDALLDLGWADATAALEGDAEGGETLGRIADAARRSGCRATIGGPSWSEDPEQVWAALQRARHRRTPSIDATPPDLPRRVRRRFVRHEAADAAELLARREATKATLLQLGGLLRRVEVEIGRRLAAAGVIDEAADVVFLADGEIESSLAGDPPSQATVARRRRSIAAAEVEGPLPLAFQGSPQSARTPSADGDRFIGWSASSGRYDGRPRVVTDVRSAGVCKGDIIVARRTDPSWAPLFLSAGALVVEEGGPLSHAAIVARELGVPAVVNVPGIVDRLERLEGDVTLSVDGTAGVVVVHEHHARVDPVPGPAIVAPREPPSLHADATNRLGVFVTGLMGAGALLSLALAATDAVTSARGRRRLASRARRVAPAVAAATDQPLPVGRERSDLIPSRRALAAVATLAAVVAAGLVVGAILAIAHGGALWPAVSVAGVVQLGLIVAAAVTSLRRWPELTPEAWRFLKPAQHRDHISSGRSWRPVLLALVAFVALGLLAHGAEGVLLWIDEPLSAWLGADGDDPLLPLGPIDPFGQAEVAFATAGALALVGVRCRPWAIGFPLIVAVGGALNWVASPWIHRARPSWSVHAGWFDSYPSGHSLQLTLLLGTVPLATYVLSGNRELERRIRLLTIAALGILLLAHMQAGNHWPTDGIGGALLGAGLVMTLRRSLERPGAHVNCRRCPWDHADITDITASTASDLPEEACGDWISRRAVDTTASSRLQRRPRRP